MFKAALSFFIPFCCLQFAYCQENPNTPTEGDEFKLVDASINDPAETLLRKVRDFRFTKADLAISPTPGTNWSFLQLRKTLILGIMVNANQKIGRIVLVVPSTGKSSSWIDVDRIQIGSDLLKVELSLKLDQVQETRAVPSKLELPPSVQNDN